MRGLRMDEHVGSSTLSCHLPNDGDKLRTTFAWVNVDRHTGGIDLTQYESPFPVVPRRKRHGFDHQNQQPTLPHC